MIRALAALTAPILTLTLLAGCAEEEQSDPQAQPSVGSSPEASSAGPAAAPGASSEYCKLLSSDFSSVFAGIRSPEDVQNAIGMIRDVVDAAPASVDEEWETMAGAMDEMEVALTKAAQLQRDAKAGKISKKELQAQSMELQADMQSLDTPENNKAGQTVSRHAAEYCGVQLGQ